MICLHFVIAFATSKSLMFHWHCKVSFIVPTGENFVSVCAIS